MQGWLQHVSRVSNIASQQVWVACLPNSKQAYVASSCAFPHVIGLTFSEQPCHHLSQFCPVALWCL